MTYLISLPEVAYIQKDGQVLDRWYPPENMFFKFSVNELKDESYLEEAKKELLVSHKPVYLTKEEIAFYKKKFR